MTGVFMITIRAIPAAKEPKLRKPGLRSSRTSRGHRLTKIPAPTGVATTAV